MLGGAGRLSLAAAACLSRNLLVPVGDPATLLPVCRAVSACLSQHSPLEPCPAAASSHDTPLPHSSTWAPCKLEAVPCWPQSLWALFVPLSPGEWTKRGSCSSQRNQAGIPHWALASPSVSQTLFFLSLSMIPPLVWESTSHLPSSKSTLRSTAPNPTMASVRLKISDTFPKAAGQPQATAPCCAFFSEVHYRVRAPLSALGQNSLSSLCGSFSKFRAANGFIPVPSTLCPALALLPTTPWESPSGAQELELFSKHLSHLSPWGPFDFDP